MWPYSTKFWNTRCRNLHVSNFLLFSRATRRAFVVYHWAEGAQSWRERSEKYLRFITVSRIKFHAPRKIDTISITKPQFQADAPYRRNFLLPLNSPPAPRAVHARRGIMEYSVTHARILYYYTRVHVTPVSVSDLRHLRINCFDLIVGQWRSFIAFDLENIGRVDMFDI